VNRARSASGWHSAVRLGEPQAIPRLVVAFCLVVVLVALLVRFPQSFADANQAARANASLDYLDRQLGGGNSVLPDQSIAIEARGRIPAGGTFTVAVGAPRPGWPALATQASVDTYLRYFLLPRRASEDAPWVICLNCDRAAYPGATAVWQDAEQGLAILRRGT
jgi:hypothetical protein